MIEYKTVFIIDEEIKKRAESMSAEETERITAIIIKHLERKEKEVMKKLVGPTKISKPYNMFKDGVINTKIMV